MQRSPKKNALHPYDAYVRRTSDRNRLVCFARDQQWSLGYLNALQNRINTKKAYHDYLNANATIFVESVTVLLPKSERAQEDTLQASLDFDPEEFEQAEHHTERKVQPETLAS